MNLSQNFFLYKAITQKEKKYSFLKYKILEFLAFEMP